MGKNDNKKKPRGYGHVLSTAALVSDPERYNRSLVSRFFSREELMRIEPDKQREEINFADLFPDDEFGEI